MAFVKKQAAAAAQRATNAGHPTPSASSPVTGDPSRRPDSDIAMRDATGDGTVDLTKKETPGDSTAPSQLLSIDVVHPTEPHRSSVPTTPHGSADAAPSYPVRQPWEYVDEVVQILKTAFPLLILSMETVVDQIHQRFKATTDEEVYRLICMLLQDAIQVGHNLDAPQDSGIDFHSFRTMSSE